MLSDERYACRVHRHSPRPEVTMAGTIVDMHIHTTNGASDSQLRPEEMAEIAKGIGLTGVNVTEHDRVWDKYTADAFRRDHPHLFLSPGMEVSTDLGHIIVVGLKEYVGGIRKCEELRRVVSEVGGYMHVAHAFGKPGVGGSDAHSRSGVAYYCTQFEKELESVEEMLAELHAGRVTPIM